MSSRGRDLIPWKASALRQAERRRRVDAQFLPAALEIVETPPSPTVRLAALSLIGLLTAALLWAWFGKVDIIATAPGRVIPSGRTKVMQPFDTGVVRAIQVADGQHVTAGQVLIVLDPTASRAELDKAVHDLVLARLDAARHSALLAGVGLTPPAGVDAAALATARGLMKEQAAEQAAKLASFDHQLAEKQAEIALQAAEIHRIDATLPMVEAHMRIRAEGLRTGFGSLLDYYDTRRMLVDQQQRRVVEQARLEAANQAFAALLRQRAEAVSQYRSGQLERLAKSQADAAGLEQDVIRLRRRAALQTLRAPIAGTVQQLAVHTLGGVVTPAQPLLAIVPDETTIEVSALVPNREAGFVHPGQAAEIKVEALDFTRYGLLHGAVIRLSRDAVGADRFHPAPGGQEPPPSAQDSDPHYAATIRLSERGLMTEQGFVTLEPGMTVTAEIKTGRRRVLDYLLSPLEQYGHDSLRER